MNLGELKVGDKFKFLKPMTGYEYEYVVDSIDAFVKIVGSYSKWHKSWEVVKIEEQHNMYCGPIPKLTDDIEVSPKGGKQSKLECRCDLLPSKAVLRVAEVLKVGSEKYGEDNWKKIEIKSQLNHLLTHVFKYLSNDTSEDHLANISCRALFALELKLEQD